MHEVMEAHEAPESHDDNPLMLPVAVTLSILAVLVAIATLLGHRASTEEIILQTKASDQWAYYQAKSIRRYESDIARDLLKMQSGEAASRAAEKYAASAERYDKEGDEIQAEARKLESESIFKGRQALRLHFGEIFLEIGIVFASLAILTKRTTIWLASLVTAAIGIALALTTLTISGA